MSGEKPDVTPEGNRALIKDMFMDASVEYAAALRIGDEPLARERLEACNVYLDLYKELGGVAVSHEAQTT